jgi:hypothetical protein
VVDHEELKNSWIMLDCTGWGAPVWMLTKLPCEWLNSMVYGRYN